MARFEAFWEVACDHVAYLWVGFTVVLFLFILSLLALALAPRGTGSFYIALVDLGLVVVAGAVVGGMYWTCARRRREPF
jgi:Na+/proline symporter